MANTSVSGLVSGLDTATIISQLMQLEAQPQTVLKNKVTSTQAVVSALQGINAKLVALTAKASDLAKSTGWTATSATSSSTYVGVTAAAGAAPASLSFTVNQLAVAASSTYLDSHTSDAVVATANTNLTITFDDTTKSPVTVSTGDGKLSTITAALNASGVGVDAVLVKSGTDASGAATYKLSVTNEASGAGSGFTISTADGSPFLGGVVPNADPTKGTTVAGADARVTFAGQSTPTSYSSNTITGLMPGVDVTLKPGATGPVTITVGRDTQALSDSVKSMVDAVNSVLADIDKSTAYDPTTKTGGPLMADAGMRDLRDNLVSTVFGGVSLASVGVQTTRDGSLVFDPAKFATAYAADPAGTVAQFTDNTTTPVANAPTLGFAARLAAAGKAASDPVDGTVTQAIAGRNSTIKSLQDDISDWDVRLTAKQDALRRQYAALEVALGKLQDQSSWLSGQIKSLPTSG